LTKNELTLTIFLSFLSSTSILAEVNSDLYLKTFGKKATLRFISLPLFFQDKFISEVNIGVEGDHVVSYSGSSLIQALRLIIKESEIKRMINLKKDKFTDQDLNFKIIYNPSDLKLQLEAGLDIVKPSETLFQDDLIPYFASEAKRPSPFSGAINWRYEESISENDLTSTYQNATINSFFNLKSVVLENQTQFTSLTKPHWYRGNTTLIADDEKNYVRYSIGDISNNTVGYQSNKNLLGFSMSRDFSINPYRLNTPSSNTEFILESRSLVRYFINNSLIKSEYLNAGKYSVKNIPLNNGINNIIVETENEFGEKKIFNFREAFSTELLKEGESKFDLSSGYIAEDLTDKKNYQSDQGLAYSGYWKRGWNDHFTGSFYAQNRDTFRLFGIENVFATKIGNWNAGFGNTLHDEGNGTAINLGYSLTSFNSFLGNSQNFNLRLEKRNRRFSDSFEYSSSRFKYNINTSYSIPVNDLISLGIGGQYSKPYENQFFEKLGGDVSLTGRLFNNTTVTFFSSLVRDEFKSWNKYFYLFVNISFPSQSTYVSTYYESQGQTKKISLYHDRGEVINEAKVQASIEENRYTKDADIDLQYNTKFADMGLRQIVRKQSGLETSGRTQARVLSSVLFASNGDNLKFAISRPVPSGFALFASDEKLKGQLIGVKSYGVKLQSETGLFDRFVVNDLVPYQYRRIQLDTSKLKDGFSLEKESFIVYPTYKSGHLIEVKSLGVMAIRGRLVDKKGKALSMLVGQYLGEDGIEYPFFTNKNGRFFIGSCRNAKGKIILDDGKYEALEINLEKDATGIQDLKDVIINEIKK
jgi:outer membrane usher protein